MDPIAKRTFHLCMYFHRFCSILLFCSVLPAAAQDPLHRRITMQDGLPSNTAYRCMQDNAGFLWISTDAGVMRFDGRHLDRFGLEQGLSDEDVFATKCDSKGRIWFFTANGRPCYVDGGKVSSWRTDSSLAKVHLPSGIAGFHEDANGSLWFGGLRAELAVVHPDGKVVQRDIHDPSIGLERYIVSFLPLKDGGMQVFMGRDPVTIHPDFLLTGGSDGGRRDATPGDPIERSLIVSADSVEEWLNGRWSLFLHRSQLPGAPLISNVSVISEDEIWVCLRSGGVLWLRRNGDQWSPVRDIMFQKDLITHVLRDKEGNVWLSTSYGGVILVSVHGINTAFFQGERGGNEEFLRAYAADGIGIWTGTNQGDVYRLGQEGLELIDLHPPGPLFARVNSIRSHAQELWVTTEHRTFRIGLSQNSPQVEEVHGIHAPPDEGDARLGLKALTISQKGRVVGSTYGLVEFDHQIQAFRPILDTAIRGVRIYAPHFDSRGTLWFEENGALNALSEAGFRSYPQSALELEYRITDIASIGDTLFLATNGKGVLVVADGKLLRRITRKDGLSSDNVHRIFQEGGELFLATNRGADRICGPWHEPVVRGYLAGLSGAFRNVRDVVAHEDHAYILFVNGLMRLPRSQELVSIGTPQAYIRSVHVNDSIVYDPDIVGVNGKKDRLVVELGAIHFSASERVSLQYRLYPDLQWHQPFGSSVDLSATEAGNHRLQVRAAIGDGRWSDTKELMIVVVPPLMERWWAKTLIALVLAVLIYATLRFMAYRRYKARVARLREREQLAAARHRIAMDLHDDLGAELSSVLLLTRMEREHPVPESLERVEHLVSTLTENVKEVIWSTDPDADSLESTLVFIQRYAIKLCERHGLRIRTTLPAVLPKVELAAGKRRELYLIAKEVLSNTIKHADATALTFIANVTSDTLMLDLADDGRGGATTSGILGGNGLQNMTQRAQGIGAGLSIQEVRPHGTRVIVTLPLEPGSPNG